MSKIFKAIFLVVVFFFTGDALADSHESRTTHIVKFGESLMTISNQHYDTHQCWKPILKANRGQLNSKNEVEVGQVLVIPPKKTCPKYMRKRRAAMKVKKKKVVVVKEAPKFEMSDFLKGVKREREKKYRNKYLYGPYNGALFVFDELKQPYLEPVKNGYTDSIKKRKTKNMAKKKKVVKLMKIGKKPKYTLQVGSYATKAEAHAKKARMELNGFNPYVVPVYLGKKGTWYRVHVGQFSNKKEAKEFAVGKQVKQFVGPYFVTKVIKPSHRPKRMPASTKTDSKKGIPYSDESLQNTLKSESEKKFLEEINPVE